MNKKGCSTTKNGMEEWERFQTRGRIFFQYDYRTYDGNLFSCVGPSLEQCRIRKDYWLAVLHDYKDDSQFDSVDDRVL